VSFSPTSIAGCVLWLRGDLGITLNGSTVSAWADQSGNGNNATQATAAKQPGTSTAINGQACVNFTGTTALQMANFVASGAKTVICVRKISSPGGGYFDAITLNTGTLISNLIWSGIGGGYKNLMFQGDATFGSLGLIGVTQTLTTAAHVDYFDFNGGSSTATGSYNEYFDGAAQTVSTSPGLGLTASDLSAIGGRIVAAGTISQGVVGDLGEVIVYNSVVSATNRNNLAAYLQTRWGVTMAGASVLGDATQKLGGLRQSVTGAETFSATAAQKLGGLRQSASGVETFSGPAAQKLGGLRQAVVSKFGPSSTASQKLGGLQQALAGISSDDAVIAQRLGGLRQSALASVPSVALIAQKLSRLRQSAAAQQLLSGTVMPPSSPTYALMIPTSPDSQE
jgi:hypothetical protein